MDQRLKQLGAGLALVATLGFGAAGAHGVFAQDATPTPSSGTSATTPSTSTNDTTNDQGKGWDDDQDGDMGRGGRGGDMRGGMHGPDGMRGGMGRGIMVDPDAFATFLGITVDQLGTELQNGDSILQIAANHGKTRADVETFLVDQYRTKLTERLDEIEAQDAGTGTGGGTTTDDGTATPATNATPASAVNASPFI